MYGRALFSHARKAIREASECGVNVSESFVPRTCTSATSDATSFPFPRAKLTSELSDITCYNISSLPRIATALPPPDNSKRSDNGVWTIEFPQHQHDCYQLSLVSPPPSSITTYHFPFCTRTSSSFSFPRAGASPFTPPIPISHPESRLGNQTPPPPSKIQDISFLGGWSGISCIFPSTRAGRELLVWTRVPALSLFLLLRLYHGGPARRRQRAGRLGETAQASEQCSIHPFAPLTEHV